MAKDNIFTVYMFFYTFALLSFLHFINWVNGGHMDTVQDI